MKARDEKLKKRKAKPKEAKATKGPSLDYSWKDVRGWFTEVSRKRHPNGYVIAPWGGKERKLATELLKAYGPELVEKAGKHMGADFAGLCARFKITSSEPSISILWGFKDSIFAEAQTGEKKVSRSDRLRGEFDVEAEKERRKQGASVVGWGNAFNNE